MIAELISYIDYILYAYIALCVGYIALFSLASRHKRKTDYAEASRFHSFIFLIPAYKEDAVICDSVSSAIAQNYPEDKFRVLVISDRMEKTTNNTLQQIGAEVLPIHVTDSSKSKALKTAISYLKSNALSYDYVIILDADNVVSGNYLHEINKVITQSKCKILQTHRKAKNLNTPTAILDAAIEEMNNSIFRAGHINLGFSSALIGSGMVMDYDWFSSNIFHTDSAGEDKELEELLLRQHIHIAYADHIFTWDEKVQKKEVLRNQRRRWIATQFFLASLMWKHLPEAISKKNGDYIIKTIQSFILPRSILLGILGLISLISLFIPYISSTKWWILLILLLTGMYIAIPSSIKNKELLKAIGNVPYFVCMMIFNLFHIKGAAKKFIHTRHG